MKDDELTETQAAALSDLMHRAADGLEVAERRPDALEALVHAVPRPRGRWLAVAAVVALVAAVGTAWRLSADGGQRVDTGPSATTEPTVTISPSIGAEIGIWRLPEEDAAVAVLGAQEDGSRPSAQVAVDDPDAPTRWIMIGDYGVDFVVDGRTRTVDVAEDMTIVLRPDDDPEGSSRFAMRDGSGFEFVTGMYRGVEDDQVVEMLTRAFPDAVTLSTSELRAAALAAIAPPAGLVPTWDPAVVQRESDTGSADSIQLTLLADTDAAPDTEIVVTMNQLGLPPAVAALLTRLQGQQMQVRMSGSEQPVSQKLIDRPELGQHVYELSYQVDGAAAVPGAQLMVLTDDGVMITVARSIESTETTTATPLSETEQIRIINSLRSSDRPTFVARLESEGVEFLASGSERSDLQASTTVESGEGP